jgi:hypothetical protein
MTDGGTALPKHTSTMCNRRRKTAQMRAALAAAICLGALVGFAPAASAQSWQQPERLSEASRDGNVSPQVVVDAHGTAIAVWASDGENLNAVEVSERPASTGVWQAPVSLSKAGQIAWDGHVAIAPDGEAIAVWEQQNDGHAVVYSSVKAPGGSWGSPVALTNPSGEDSEPQIAIDAGGEAVALWENNGEKSNGESTIVLQAAARPGPGTAWGAPVDLSDTSAEAVDPQIALNEEGEALAAWRLSALSTQAVQVAVRPPKSGWEAPLTLSGAGYAGAPLVALNGQGAAVITWASRQSQNVLIEAASRSTANSEWASAVTLAEGELNPERFESPQAAIGIDAAGSATAVWPLLSGNKNLVQAAAMSSGGSWQPATTITETSFEGSEPHLAMNPQGEAVAIWTARVGGELSAQGSSLSDPAGTWSPAQTLSTPGGNEFEPTVAIDSGGGGFAVWDSAQSDEDVIQAATYIPPDTSEVTITTSKSRALLGETVTLKAKIEPTPEDPHPGTVRFSLANELEVDPNECEVAVNATTGEASCEISETDAAEFEWVAEYSGSEDGIFPAATSAPLKMEWVFPSPCTSGYYSATGLEPCVEADPGSYVAESGATSETLCSEGAYQPDSHSERCNPSELGHYVEGKGATSQTACEAGTFDAGSGSTLATDCIAASLGHFVANEGEGSEEECAIGSYASITHSEVCVPAEPGHYVAQPGAASQQECVAGTYSSNQGESSCSTTPEGNYSAAGATTPISCDPGTNDPHTNSTTSAACETDPAGSYSGSGAASATLCDAGTSNSNTGSTTSAACELDVAGSWSAPGAASATLCAAGTYSAIAGATSSAACQEAGPGYSDPTAGLTEEVPCQPGDYAPLSDSEHCTPAGLGHYVSEQAQSTEQECPAGTYAGTTQSTLCKPAETGHYVSQAGSASQQECVAGTYSERTEATTCSTTPEGDYSGSGAVAPTPCGPGTTNPTTGATSSAACEADGPGSYSGSGATQASLCEPGTFQPNTGSSDCEEAEAGHYVNAHGASAQTECPAGTYSSVKRSMTCLTAPKNTYTSAGAIEPLSCAKGTESAPGSSSCTPVPTAPKEEPKTEVKAETKVETPTTTTTTPPVEQPAKGHEATPIVTKLKLNHSCLAPATLVLDSRAAQGLNLSFRLNETASIEYKIAPGKGAAKLAKCPSGKGHSKAKPEPVWTGPHIAGKGKKQHKVAPTKVSRTLTAGSHQVPLAAALAAAHINAKHLRPGTYVLTVIAVNAEGKRSIAETIEFWVVNRP